MLYDWGMATKADANKKYRASTTPQKRCFFSSNSRGLHGNTGDAKEAFTPLKPLKNIIQSEIN